MKLQEYILCVKKINIMTLFNNFFSFVPAFDVCSQESHDACVLCCWRRSRCSDVITAPINTSTHCSLLCKLANPYSTKYSTFKKELPSFFNNNPFFGKEQTRWTGKNACETVWAICYRMIAELIMKVEWGGFVPNVTMHIYGCEVILLYMLISSVLQSQTFLPISL